MKSMKLGLRLVLVALLSSLLTACQGTGEILDQVTSFVQDAIDFESRAFVNPDTVAQIINANPVLVWGMLGIALICLFAFMVSVIVSAARGERVAQTIAQRHWFWVFIMAILPSPFLAYKLTSDVGLFIWKALGIGPDLARRAMGFTIPYLESGGQPDFASFVGIPLTYGYLDGHKAFQILLVTGLLIAIFLAILMKSLRPLWTWLFALSMFVLMDFSWGLTMQTLAADNPQPGSTYCWVMLGLLVFPLGAVLFAAWMFWPHHQGEPGEKSSWWADKGELAWEAFQTWLLYRESNRKPDIRVSDPNAPRPKPGQAQLPPGQIQNGNGGQGGKDGDGKTPPPNNVVIEGQWRPANDGSDGRPIITPPPGERRTPPPGDGEALITPPPADGTSVAPGEATHGDPRNPAETPQDTSTPPPESRYYAHQDVIGPDGTVYARAGSQVYPDISGDQVSVNGIPTTVEERGQNGEILSTLGYVAGAATATALGAPELAPVAGEIGQELVKANPDKNTLTNTIIAGIGNTGGTS